MAPSLAALLTFVFVVVLYLRGSHHGGGSSGALWLPVLWLGITGSRFVSQWMGVGEAQAAAEVEGSPIDALYFGTLIVAGIVVLVRRGVAVKEVVRGNRWLFAFLVYSFAAVLWSDFPLVAFKRWVKTLGHPVMALIIITDPDPVAALRTVMKRCAYLLLPLSVLLIKYFPGYGRGFDPYTGKAFYNGAGLTKNDLGYVCMVLGLFFFSNLLTQKRLGDRRTRREEILLSFGFLLMVGWLMKMADSATSLVGLTLGVGTMVLLGSGLVSKRSVGTFVVISLLIAVAAEFTFGLYENVIGLLGRDPSLTDRTHVWADALALQDRPILGVGFESFWLGPRLEALWAKWWWRPRQSHNNYIETYLNLGLVGVFLLLAVLVSTFRKISKQLSTNFEFARLRLGLLVAIIAFSFTEAGFKGVHFVWTMFYIIALDYPRRGSKRTVRLSLDRSESSSSEGARDTVNRGVPDNGREHVPLSEAGGRRRRSP
jgi:exopolysaccharide production protein ExoQ